MAVPVLKRSRIRLLGSSIGHLEDLRSCYVLRYRVIGNSSCADPITTLFTLDWISDPALRRRTSAGLNKGEARNALARALFFHRHGELRDRTFENQALPRLRPQPDNRGHHPLEHGLSQPSR